MASYFCLSIFALAFDFIIRFVVSCVYRMEIDANKIEPVLSVDDEDVQRHCPACGAKAREQARFCSTCGRALEGSYFPMDALRSSYHQQESYEKKLRKTSGKNTEEKKGETEATAKILRHKKNSIAKMALALATYSLVPYLGILLCPCAVLLGGIGLVRSYRFPKYGGRHAAFTSIILGILTLCLQLVLWWLLYQAI